MNTDQLHAALAAVLKQSGLPDDLKEGRALIMKDWRKKGAPQGDVASLAIINAYDVLTAPVHEVGALRQALHDIVSLVQPIMTKEALQARHVVVRAAHKRATKERDLEAIGACNTALLTLEALLS